MPRLKHSRPLNDIARLKHNLTKSFRVTGKKVYLRPLTVEDATRRYCSWMNDPDVIRYTESRYSRKTVAGLKRYIVNANRGTSNFFFAIIDKRTDRHVGNIKIESAVNPFWDHLVAEIGLIIGEKNCWGMGFGTEAIRLMTRFCFNVLKVRKITAQCYSINVGSAKAFRAAGYVQECLRRANARYNGKQIDLLLFGAINPRFKR